MARPFSGAGHSLFDRVEFILSLPMNHEACTLGGAILLGLVHVGLQSLSMTAQLGVAYNVSSRDEPAKVSGAAARLERASKNFQETLPLFVAAIVLTLLTQQSNALTQVGGWLYLGARCVYLPLYWLGIRYLRTLAWVIASGGILAVAVGALCP